MQLVGASPIPLSLSLSLAIIVRHVTNQDDFHLKRTMPRLPTHWIYARIRPLFFAKSNESWRSMALAGGAGGIQFSRAELARATPVPANFAMTALTNFGHGRSPAAGKFASRFALKATIEARRAIVINNLGGTDEARVDLPNVLHRSPLPPATGWVRGFPRNILALDVEREFLHGDKQQRFIIFHAKRDVIGAPAASPAMRP